MITKTNLKNLKVNAETAERICNEAYNPDSLMEYHPNPDFKKG